MNNQNALTPYKGVRSIFNLPLTPPHVRSCTPATQRHHIPVLFILPEQQTPHQECTSGGLYILVQLHRAVREWSCARCCLVAFPAMYLPPADQSRHSLPSQGLHTHAQPHSPLAATHTLGRMAIGFCVQSQMHIACPSKTPNATHRVGAL